MSAQLTLRKVFWAATSLGEIVLICITFLACLFIWIQAVRVYAPAREFVNPESVPSDFYGALSPEVNVRLRLLNDPLAQLLRSESPRL